MNVNNAERVNKEEAEMFKNITDEVSSMYDTSDLICPSEDSFKDKYIKSLERLVEEKERAIELIECNYNNIIEKIEREKMILETKCGELSIKNKNKAIVSKDSITISNEDFNNLVGEISKINTKDEVDLNKIQDIVNSLMNRNKL